VRTALPADLAQVRGRVLVIGAGKASAAMAQAVESHWRGRGLERVEGLVVTRYGYGAPCERIEIVGRPPRARCRGRGRRAPAARHGAGPGRRRPGAVPDLGGGSALLPLAGEGLTLADKQAVNKALLASGASIAEMNCVRRHLSAIKGGRLAAACHPARVLTLLISDVPGDLPDIASGPTVADASTCADALAIVQRYGIALPPPRAPLARKRRGRIDQAR
jgi:hydroxypyruvate reductase